MPPQQSPHPAAAPRALVLPGWVPAAAYNYLAHTTHGIGVRALARRADCHASTISRQIRRFENRRDDPLVDSALSKLAGSGADDISTERQAMTQTRPISETTLRAEAPAVLRALSEPRAVLAVADGLETALIVIDGAETRTRGRPVPRALAEAMALKDWISCADAGRRLSRYVIAPAGRALLRQTTGATTGLAEVQSGFAMDLDDGDDPRRLRHLRSTLAESPLAGLARRREKDGAPFLARDLVRAGERLREDFELAQTGQRSTMNWDGFLTAGCTGGQGAAGGNAAEARVAAALAALGPGLADVALRCCCYLEGMEETERRFNWAARSGKIVLRIALHHLRRHYETQRGAGDMIG